MAKPKKAYRVLERSYIGDRLCEPGDTVLYAGEPGCNLEELKGKDAAAAEARVDDTLTL